MRGLIAVGLASSLIAAAAAAPVTPRDERKEQQQAVEAILGLGGEVRYDYQVVKTGRPGTIAFDLEAKPKDLGAFHRVVSVSLPGGDLKVEWRESDGHILMTGPYALDFEGILPAALLQAAV